VNWNSSSKLVNRRLHDEARILTAAVALMDGRSSRARMYKRLAALLLSARELIDALQTEINARSAGGVR
jgi:hypothetical protein